MHPKTKENTKKRKITYIFNCIPSFSNANHRIVNLSNALSLLVTVGLWVHTFQDLIASSFGHTVKMLSPVGLRQLSVTELEWAFVSVMSRLPEGHSCTVIEFVSGVLTKVSLWSS